MATWREWTTSVEWEPDVAPALKDRLEAFLDLVLAKQAILADRLDEATDVDVMAALSVAWLHLEMPTCPDAALTVEAVHAWAIAVADETNVNTWQLAIQGTLEHDAAPVQAVATAILLERIGRAVLASRPALDLDGVVTAAVEILEQYTRSVLLEVLKQRMPANAYRTM